MNLIVGRIARSVASCLAGFTLVVSCGGGGSGGGVAAPGSTDFLVTDAAVDQLLAFRTTIHSLALVSQSGVSGANVLLNDVPIDVLGAGAAPRWVTRRELPEGIYRGVAVSIVPGSTTAVDRSGSSVAINEVTTTFELDFANPAAVTSSGHRQITLDIDLVASLSGSIASPPLDFDPQGVASLAQGSGCVSAIDEIRGIVRSIDGPNDRLIIDAFADGDHMLGLGNVTVEFAPATLLLDDDGTAFPDSAAFFSALVVDATLVEIHGSLEAGHVVATLVEIEDDGFHGPSYVVKIDGRIAALDMLTNTFDLEIVDIEKGSSIAAPVIGGATSIAITYGASTGILLDRHTLGGESDLADGQRVKVEFPVFVSAPFSASQIEIHSQPDFECVITDVNGVPASITVTLDAHEPAIHDGGVDSSTTPVIIDLASSTLFLDTHGHPALTPAQLQAGMKVAVSGTLSGPPNGPTITATQIKVHAGHCNGVVMSMFASVHSFDVSMHDLFDPFGHNVSFGSVACDIDPSCFFWDQVHMESQFTDLCMGHHGMGGHVEVEVWGVATAIPNEVRVYEIRARDHN